MLHILGKNPEKQRLGKNGIQCVETKFNFY